MAKSKKLQSTQDFTNTLDIANGFLYTRDGWIIRYIRIFPISVGLLSRNEKRTLVKQLTSELSTENEKFHFLPISRPVDVQPLLEQYAALKANTNNPFQKELLQKEMENITEFSFGEEVVERRFYFYLVSKRHEGVEKDLKKRMEDFAEHFESVGIQTEILKDDEIIRLCNLFNNPAVVMVEDEDISPTIPMLKEK